MKHRKLRIAWSVVCGLACVLLIVLWLRSYWRADTIQWIYSTPQGIQVAVSAGHVQVSRYQFAGVNRIEWHLNRPSQEAPVLWKLGLGYGPGSVVLPLWLLAVLVAVLGFAPWVSLKRFSLRTLLIASTVVAVVLGLIVWAAR